MIKPSEKQGFSGLPLLRPYGVHESSDLMTLMEHFYYTDARGQVHWAPKGMISDGASFPRRAERFFDGFNAWLAGLIHDSMYLLSTVTKVSRKDSDALFGEMVVFTGGSGLQGWLGQTGLDLGGWHSWGECQKFGVRWSDFDTSVLDHHEIAWYRKEFNLDRGAARPLLSGVNP